MLVILASRHLSRPALVVASLSMLALLGCRGLSPFEFVIGRPRLPQATRPIADSPVNAVRLLEHCWNRLDRESYGGLFSADFRFVFAEGDSAGEPYRDQPWTRADEETAFDHVVGGGPGTPPLVRVSGVFDRDLQVTDDPQHQGSGRWRKQIRTTVVLHMLDAEQNVLEISGFTSFHLVRGDSAAVPEDVLASWARDSTRWFIADWIDETAELPGARAMPTQKLTWGGLKVRYRGDRALARATMRSRIGEPARGQ